jgi:hypothetical protein
MELTQFNKNNSEKTKDTANDATDPDNETEFTAMDTDDDSYQSPEGLEYSKHAASKPNDGLNTKLAPSEMTNEPKTSKPKRNKPKINKPKKDENKEKEEAIPRKIKTPFPKAMYVQAAKAQQTHQPKTKEIAYDWEYTRRHGR